MALAMSEERGGHVVPYRSPRQREDTTAWIGMVVFLASWMMMFGALFFAYGGLRARAPEWPPAGLPMLPLGLPGINSACIALSSAALHLGLLSARRGQTRRLGLLLLLAFALGTVFMVLQGVVWRDLYEQGLRPGSGPYGSAFYGLTWVHAAHVAIGLLALAWLAFGALRGRYTAARHLPVRLWAMYWHFVGAMWGVMFATLYLI